MGQLAVFCLTLVPEMIAILKDKQLLDLNTISEYGLNVLKIKKQ
jgi:hypothetical protein